MLVSRNEDEKYYLKIGEGTYFKSIKRVGTTKKEIGLTSNVYDAYPFIRPDEAEFEINFIEHIHKTIKEINDFGIGNVKIVREVKVSEIHNYEVQIIQNANGKPKLKHWSKDNE